jgi:prepilin-type N-terminal cleavage/methylation domain-containing protein
MIGPWQTFPGAGMRRRQAGFTLPEVMVASAIFTIVVGAIIAANLFGWRMWQATDPKLDSDYLSRALIGQITTDISCAKSLRVGTGTESGFASVPYGSLQQGNALEIQPGATTNRIIRYFHDPAAQELRRAEITDGLADTQVVARDILNDTVFRAEESAGATLTDAREKMVIAIDLEFGTLGRLAMPMGEDRYFKSHDIRLRVATRER